MVRQKRSMRNRRQNQNRGKSKGIPGLFILLVAGLIGLGGFYVFQVNHLSTMGYEVEDKESKIDELKKENELLKATSSRLRSISHLEVEQEELTMVKPQEVSYIDMGNSIAMK